MRIALISNTPPPYRVPIFNRLADWPGIDFHAVFCTRREPNRFWDLPDSTYRQHFLHESFLTYRDRYIHHNPDVIPLLLRLKADVIITDGFNPTHLYAFLLARAKHIPHVAMTDGTHYSEQALSLTHRILRRLVYRGSRGFIAASEGGQRLYRSYGIPDHRCFYSWLCVANEAFTPDPNAERPFDFIFCGRMEREKDPLFALEVARETALRLQRRTRLLFVGSGSLDQRLRDKANAEARWVEAVFQGFASQQALPLLYQSARVFLFPSHADVWGVVANEACASGLPVIVSPHAGVAGELVIEGQNGYVRDIDARAWADRAHTLLTDSRLWQRFSQNSQINVRRYNFDSAAAGIVDACQFALDAQADTLKPKRLLTSRRPREPHDPAASVATPPRS